MANEYSKETKVRIQSGNTPHFSKVSKVSVVSGGTGGGEGEYDGTISWDNVTGKPDQFAPSPHDHDERYSQIDHDHDDRYNTKEQVASEIDFVRQQMIAGQGRVSATSTDEPGYLESKVDNTTVKVEGSELVVKSIDGLTVGAADISTWLAGTSDNVQTQIDDINDNLVAMTSGMHYRGRLETYAELQSIGNLNNGDLAVVLADESREGSRSMYVYNESNGVWEFIGAFTFSDRFTSLNDTPESLDGQDGKTLVARGGRVVLENVNYDDLADKPESTITQIDDAVEKRHEHINGELLDTYNQTNADLQTAVSQSHTHSNKSAIDRIGINASGQLTIDGVVYATKNEPTEKKFLSAYLKNTQTIARGDFIKFDTIKGGSTIPYDINTGIFTLEVGKTYRVTVSVMGEIREWITIQYANEQKTNWAHPYSAVYGASSNMSARGSSGVLDTTFTVSNHTNVGILVSETHDSDNPVRLFSNRTMLVVQEL